MTYRDILPETPCFVQNHVGTYFIALEDIYTNFFGKVDSRLKIEYISMLHWSYITHLQLKSNFTVVNMKDVPIEILEKAKNKSYALEDKIKEEIGRRK